jgi:hypothetical protein
LRSGYSQGLTGRLYQCLARSNREAAVVFIGGPGRNRSNRSMRRALMRYTVVKGKKL